MFKNIRFEKSLLIFIALMCCSFVLRILGIADSFKTPMTFFVILIASYICYLEIKKQNFNKIEKLLIIISYLLHIVIMIVDIYYTPILFNGGDCDNFFDTAVKYYNKIPSGEFTYYPYFLYFLFLIFGANRVIVQYVNVVFWVTNVILLNKICHKLEIKNNIKTLLIFVVCLQPIYLCFMSLLLRDCIISTCIIYSFYELTKWKENMKSIDALLAIFSTLVGTILHVGTLAITVTIIINIALYDSSTKKLKIQKKTIIVILTFLMLIVVCFAVPKIRNGILGYIPSLKNFNLIEYYKISAIYRKTEFVGGSDYLMSDDIKNNFELLIISLRRIYYFYLSPIPSYWRGIKDVASFVSDSLLYLLAFLLLVISVIKRNWDHTKTTITLFLLSFGLFFMWGVSNAGTAMRHRDKVFLVVVIIIGYCLKDKCFTKKENK